MVRSEKPPLVRKPSPEHKPPLPRKPPSLTDIKASGPVSSKLVRTSSPTQSGGGGEGGGAVIVERVCNVCGNRRVIESNGMCGPCFMKWRMK